MAPAPFDTEGSAAYQNGGDGALHSLASRGRRVTELTEGESDLVLETTPLSPRVRSNSDTAADGVRLDFGHRSRSKSMSLRAMGTPHRGAGRKGGAVGGVYCGCCPPEGSWCRNALAVALLLLFVAATAVTAAVIVILLFPAASPAANPPGILFTQKMPLPPLHS
jgi:hypothetical protein